MTGARGFTLIEMVVVLALLAILACAAQPLLEVTLQRRQETALRQGLRALRGAIDAYRQAYDDGKIARADGASGYPPSLDVLVEGVALAASVPEDAREAQRLYLLRRLPRDPFAAPDLPAAQTWGLRSSQSPPGSPAPGRDIFDVYSQSQRHALDGSVYRQW